MIDATAKRVLRTHMHGRRLRGHDPDHLQQAQHTPGACVHRVLGMYFLVTPGWADWSDDEQEEGLRCEKPTEQVPSSTGSTTRKRQRNQAAHRRRHKREMLQGQGPLGVMAGENTPPRSESPEQPSKTRPLSPNYPRVP